MYPLQKKVITIKNLGFTYTITRKKSVITLHYIPYTVTLLIVFVVYVKTFTQNQEGVYDTRG